MQIQSKIAKVVLAQPKFKKTLLAGWKQDGAPVSASNIGPGWQLRLSDSEAEKPFCLAGEVCLPPDGPPLHTVVSEGQRTSKGLDCPAHISVR